MPEILVYPELLKEKSIELAGVLSEQWYMVEELQRFIEDVCLGWEGNAQRKFQDSFEEKKEAYRDISIELQVFVDFLRGYASAWEGVNEWESRVRLTPENLIAGAQSLKRVMADNDDLLNRLDNLVDGLESGWHSEAQKAFTAAYQAKRATFRQFSLDMEGLIMFLERYAEMMRAIDHMWGLRFG